MKLSIPIRNIIFIWLGWAVILLGFQSWMQIELKRPDAILNWTVTETGLTSNKDQPYLSNPLLNGHIARDSEFYLAIADEGYALSQGRAIPGNFSWDLARWDKHPVCDKTWILLSVLLMGQETLLFTFDFWVA